MKTNTVELGDTVRDTVTGFTGIAVATTRWLNNCVRITVQPTKLGKEGGTRPTETIDEPQLEIVKRAFRPTSFLDARGGPRPEPIKHSPPVR